MMLNPRFKEGDRVELVKPFTCEGDDEDTQDEIRQYLALAFGSNPITGRIDDVLHEYYHVEYDREIGGSYGEYLYTDEDCLDFEKRITDEDVEDAIRSIAQVIQANKTNIQ